MELYKLVIVSLCLALQLVDLSLCLLQPIHEILLLLILGNLVQLPPLITLLDEVGQLAPFLSLLL